MLDICIRLHSLRADGHKRAEVYRNKLLKTFDIGLLDEHYFVINNSDITTYAINNYHEIKDEENANQIIYKRDSGTYKRSTTTRY